MGFEKLDYKILDEKKMASKSEAFLKKMGTRRTVRDFSTKNVPITIKYSHKAIQPYKNIKIPTLLCLNE